jgi:hypothetical protein
LIDEQSGRLFAASLRQAAETGADLDRALAELGWLDALAADARFAVATLFEVQGERLATSAALDRVLAAALGVDAAAVLLPRAGSAAAPGSVCGGRLIVRGLCRAPSGEVLVVAGDVGVLLPLSTLDVRPVGGLDPSVGLHEVCADLPLGDTVALQGSWACAVAAGRRALAHELAGASRTMLRLAIEHATQREQFGRPIAGFQAVRHRLAEAHVALEAAVATTQAAWDFPSPQHAALAKIAAGQAARTVARHAQQVLAGMGFTTEHDFHRYLRRTRVLDELLGSSTVLTRELGDQVLARRELPAMLPL